MGDLETLAKLIGENLPSPYGLDAVWRQTDDGAEFDLEQADDHTRREWLELAELVLKGNEA